MKSKFKFSLLMMLLAFMSFAAPPPFPQYDIDDNIEIVVSSDYRYLTCEAVSPIVKSPNQEINYNQVYSVS
ncbi:MAG TPA: hypothetical protein PJ990_14540, partial [Saprospiraceae bacterium]|nr:hypothetical protein [Saprospiraceae bacterium]